MEPPEGGRNTLAVVVMHRGQVVAERYGAPVTAATPMQGWSFSKGSRGISGSARNIATTSLMARCLISNGDFRYEGDITVA